MFLHFLKLYQTPWLPAASSSCGPKYHVLHSFAHRITLENVVLFTRYYRDTGMEGWSGGSDGTKVFVFEVDMPHCGEDDFEECTYNRPAVWALNAKVRVSVTSTRSYLEYMVWNRRA